MNRAMICEWLGLPDLTWPPDPYALLGLTPGECDAARIEQRVHERMGKLRCYQLSHPAEATEGMNRVAQAFIYLVEQHCPRRAAAAAAPAPAPAAAAPPVRTPPPVRRPVGDTAVVEKTRVDWQGAPPPVRTAKKEPRAVIPVGLPEPPVRRPAAEPEPPPASAETEEQLVRGLAEDAEEARAGLVTLPLVIARADRTRQLLIAWRRAGRYLGNPKRKLGRAVERSDFSRRLEEVLEAVEHYPAFVAHPGRPGYRAAALAHLTILPEVFNAMGEEPREQLARDWALAHKILLAHRRFLLRQFKTLRRRGPLGRAAHTLRTSLREHPVLWSALGAVAGVTLIVSLGLLMLP